jgi:Holliday junction resolvase RusA-like endonuclease
MPPSTNQLYYTGKDGKRHLSKEGREYKKEVGKLMMVGGVKKKCPLPPFSLYIHVRFRDWRRQDISNRIKLLEDAVLGYLNYDDKMVYDLIVYKYISKNDPGVVVELRNTTRDLVVQ